MAERERELVDPLQVVDDEQRRFERAEGPVRTLEQPHGLERRRARGVEEHSLDLGSALRHLAEGAQEPGRGRERHLALGLVADDGERVREGRPGSRLGEQPALAAAGLADDDDRGRARPARRRELHQGFELSRPADEHLHHTPARERMTSRPESQERDAKTRGLPPDDRGRRPPLAWPSWQWCWCSSPSRTKSRSYHRPRSQHSRGSASPASRFSVTRRARESSSRVGHSIRHGGGGGALFTGGRASFRTLQPLVHIAVSTAPAEERVKR